MGAQVLSGLSIEELLRRARAGDEGAMEELFRRCRLRLAKWASKPAHRGQPGGARPSDVSQDAALRAFQHFSTFQGSTEAEWYTWLKKIFLNQATQLLRNARRKKREAPGTVPLDTPEAQEAPMSQKSPSQATAHQEEWRLLLANLFQLPEDQHKAIYLCHLKELPVAEVARLMGRTEASVASLVQRGLRTLRVRMVEGAGAEAGMPSSMAAAWNDAAAALLMYLRRRETGEDVDPAAFAAEHPGCADELRVMLHWIGRLQSLRPSLPA